MKESRSQKFPKFPPVKVADVISPTFTETLSSNISNDSAETVPKTSSLDDGFEVPIPTSPKTDAEPTILVEPDIFVEPVIVVLPLTANWVNVPTDVMFVCSEVANKPVIVVDDNISSPLI